MRRKIEKALGFFILFLAIIYALAYLFLVVTGKAILINQIQRITHKKTTIDYFSITPILRIDIKGLDVQGLAKSSKVSTSISIVNLLRGRVVLRNLTFIQPEFFVNKTPPEVANPSIYSATLNPSVKPPPAPKEAKPVSFGILRLDIRDGKVIFIDQTIKSGSIKISVEEISAYIKNFYLYPVFAITEFKLSAIIPWKEGEDKGKLELDGWINTHKGDMSATCKVNDIDAIYLYPYYSTWVDLKKARIEKAKLNFLSEIHGLNNDVTADCFLELTDMVRKPLEIGEPEAKASKLTNAVLDRFKELDNGEVKLNFKIKTKMDSPQFGFENFKSAFEEKLMRGRSTFKSSLQDSLSIPVKAVENGFRSFTDLSRAMIDGVFAIGNQVKESADKVMNGDKDKQSSSN
ncbi:MAG: hypothetical protein WAQ07_03700 [Candidatus Omnitrophota bacterium]